jgi:hypothetical protein
MLIVSSEVEDGAITVPGDVLGPTRPLTTEANNMPTLTKLHKKLKIPLQINVVLVKMCEVHVARTLFLPRHVKKSVS